MKEETGGSGKKRRSALGAVCLAAALMLSSCGVFEFHPLTPESSGTETTETTARSGALSDVKPVELPEYESQAKALLDALPDRQSEGSSSIVGCYGQPRAFCFETEGEEADTVDTARMKSRAMIRERYGSTVLTQTFASREDLIAQLKLAKATGDYLTDFLAIPAGDLGLFWSQDLLRNLQTLPYVDFSAAYYNGAAMAQLSGGTRILAAVGSATESYTDAYALYFNRTMAEKLGLTLPYAAAAGGEWTLEALQRWLKEGMTAGEDEIGRLRASDASLAVRLLCRSTGVSAVKAGYGVSPALCYGEALTADLLTGLHDLLYGGYFAEDNQSGSRTSAFASGQALCYIGSLAEAKSHADFPFSWGILPLPKSTEEQSGYASPVDSTAATVLTVPSSKVDASDCGLMLEALHRACWGHIRIAELREMMVRVLRDNDSVNMLRLITGSTRYDFIDALGSAFRGSEAGTWQWIASAVRRGSLDSAAYRAQKATWDAAFSKEFPTPLIECE